MMERNKIIVNMQQQLGPKFKLENQSKCTKTNKQEKTGNRRFFLYKQGRTIHQQESMARSCSVSVDRTLPAEAKLT